MKVSRIFVVGHSISVLEESSLVLLRSVVVVAVARRRVVVEVPLAIMRDVEEKAEVQVAHERIMVMAGGTILI